LRQHQWDRRVARSHEALSGVVRPQVAFVVLGALLTACRPGQPADAGNPTFARDIAPILSTNCAGCHRPGQIAPFSLLTFDDVRARAAQVVRAVETRRMPPWLPEPGVNQFLNARELPQKDIATIRRWVENGMARGSVEDVAAVPARDGAWQLGTPDIVASLQDSYTLPAGTADVFRNFVVAVPVSKPVFVRGVEFRPDVAAAVHHAVIGVDGSGESRRLDAADPEPGYEGMLSEDFHSPDGHFIGWTPGRTPALEPPDMAWRLEPGTDLVVQLHMLPSSQPTTLQPQIGLYLSETPPTRVPFMVKLTSTAIDIPPGVTDYVVDDSYTLPVDVDTLSVYPHAHYLAREITATATLPGGESKSLLVIRNWDFHWQEFYRYAQPIPLPRGTTLAMRITYDNSPEHQHHPGTAPRRVVYGPRSSDEMADLWLQVLPRRPDDLGTLARDFVARRAETRLAAARQAAERAPRDAAAHNLLGTRYLATGRTDDAVRAFATALRLQPDYPEARNNLGATLVGAGRAGEALPHLRAAAKARPNDARVQFNLGNALRDSGLRDEAAKAFERSLTLEPRSADAHNNLGVLEGTSGRYERALGHFEQALSLRETYPEAHHNLALALAALGRRGDAVVHVRRAIQLRPEYAEARSTLIELEGAAR
jgi:Flp pilus assembly protein TadD